MATKKTSGLTAGLVAVKGAAQPPAADAAARTAPVVAAKDTSPPAEPLNFRVTVDFRRDFRVYAAQKNLKLNELLVLCFEEYKKQNPA